VKNIQIFDNIISLEKQEEIKNLLYGNNFPWYYINDVTLSNKNPYQQRPALNHLYVDDERINSDKFSKIKIIFDEGSKRLNKKFKPIKVRSFMQFPLNKNIIGENYKDTPHLDMEKPHTVFLYYVNDSDGETIIYDYNSKNINDVPLFENIKIIKKVKPKQGRLIVFDGFTWHSSSQPRNNVRTVINFDLCSI